MFDEKIFNVMSDNLKESLKEYNSEVYSELDISDEYIIIDTINELIGVLDTTEYIGQAGIKEIYLNELDTTNYEFEYYYNIPQITYECFINQILELEINIKDATNLFDINERLFLDGLNIDYNQDGIIDLVNDIYDGVEYVIKDMYDELNKLILDYYESQTDYYSSDDGLLDELNNGAYLLDSYIANCTNPDYITEAVKLKELIREVEY